jgi:hypothetical protein
MVLCGYTFPFDLPARMAPRSVIVVDAFALASDTVGLLVPYLQQLGAQAAGRLSERTADHVADTVGGAVARVYRLLKDRLRPGSHELDQLTALGREPENAAYQQALTAALAEYLGKHPELAGRLGELVDEAAKANVQMQAINSGFTAGGSIRISAGGSVVGRDASGGSPSAQG